MAPKPHPFTLPPGATHLLGIDPGLSGAIALVKLAGNQTPLLIHIWDMPAEKGGIDPLALASIFIDTAVQFPNVSSVIERVHSLPRQAGAFNFGFYTGLVHGALAAAGIGIHTVPPTVWKPALGLHRQPDETPASFKDRSRQLAMALYPDDANYFKRKKDDGRAEALLIATWAALFR